MKSSPKKEAKDVNEPVKSLMTAVTTVAPAIKHGALTAPEIHLGRLSAAPAHHTCTCRRCTRLQMHARTPRLSEQRRGENGDRGRRFSTSLGPNDRRLGSRVGAQASFWSVSSVVSPSFRLHFIFAEHSLIPCTLLKQLRCGSGTIKYPPPPSSPNTVSNVQLSRHWETVFTEYTQSHRGKFLRTSCFV